MLHCTVLTLNFNSLFLTLFTDLQEELQEQLKQELELKEEQHRQEIQRLRRYYCEQIRETEERFTNEILLLQDRLEDMTPEDTLPRSLTHTHTLHR